MAGGIIKTIEMCALSWARNCTSKIFNFLLTLSLGHTMNPPGWFSLLSTVNRRLEEQDLGVSNPISQSQREAAGTPSQPGDWRPPPSASLTAQIMIVSPWRVIWKIEKK